VVQSSENSFGWILEGELTSSAEVKLLAASASQIEEMTADASEVARVLVWVVGLEMTHWVELVGL
jgi:hypothetical protein